MSWKVVDLIIESKVRDLCYKAYPNHKRGCPNYGKKRGCPPNVPIITEVIDLEQTVWVVWNVFDFSSHCERMEQAHPDWSRRQIECCLYWQGTARKHLRETLEEFMDKHGQHIPLAIISCPEAMGVNVTKTMRQIGQELEWPPVTKTYQVAVAGFLSDNAPEEYCKITHKRLQKAKDSIELFRL
jgi:predicted metal-binding protein